MVAFGLFWFLCVFGAAFSEKKNVLFLVVDDLRPELGCYSGKDFPSPKHPIMVTPNMDKLAAKSLLLKRAYVQGTTCSPSRTSVLTGRRPDTTHVYDLKAYFRKVGGNFTTIPQYFKQNGYLSIGMGKIFHPGSASGYTQDAPSWSPQYPYYVPKNKKYWTSKDYQPSHKAVPRHIYKKNPLPDDEVTQHAIETLRQVSDNARNGSKPFFVAVGFMKPHLPFIFPKKFLDYYPKNKIKLPNNPYAPVKLPDAAWSHYEELRKYRDIKVYNFSGNINTTLPKGLVKDVRRYYYSAVTYVDFLIGKILQELKVLGLEKNTIISLWGDHGWQLGEHGEWCKHTNFELSTHAPMMVHIPGMTERGIVTEKLTEFVDLFPTLVDAAGLPTLKRCPRKSKDIQVCTEGTSLIPLISKPKKKKENWKVKVFSQTARHKHLMGYSMRTDRFRYTEWVHFKTAPWYKPKWNINYGTELYDHKRDPEENWNRADDQTYKGVRRILSTMLRSGWRSA